MSEIKQSVINTFDRVGIPYKTLDNITKDFSVFNRFTNEEVKTTELISYLIYWVYDTSNAYEMGVNKVSLADFDRIRYFVLSEDQKAYITCLD